MIKNSKATLSFSKYMKLHVHQTDDTQLLEIDEEPPLPEINVDKPTDSKNLRNQIFRVGGAIKMHL